MFSCNHVLLFYFKGYSLSDVQSCSQKGLKVGVNIYDVYVQGGISVAGCKAILKEIGGKCITIAVYQILLIQSLDLGVVVL